MRAVKAECLECRKLPVGERPATPRPIDKRSGPKSPRCHTHIEAKRTRRAKQQQAWHRTNQHGMSPDQHAKLAAKQGGTCPCGNRIKHIDHDHRIARTVCDHPVDQGCQRCWRGLLCHVCNTDILGRGYNQRRLLALVAYLDKPPAQELFREEEAS